MLQWCMLRCYCKCYGECYGGKWCKSVQTGGTAVGLRCERVERYLTGQWAAAIRHFPVPCGDWCPVCWPITGKLHILIQAPSIKRRGTRTQNNEQRENEGTGGLRPSQISDFNSLPYNVALPGLSILSGGLSVPSLRERRIFW